MFDAGLAGGFAALKGMGGGGVWGPLRRVWEVERWGEGFSEGADCVGERSGDGKWGRLRRDLWWKGRELLRRRKCGARSIAERLDLLAVRGEDVWEIVRILKRNITARKIRG